LGSKFNIGDDDNNDHIYFINRTEPGC